MSSNQVVLGIDCGTQSMKAILYHLQQEKIVARASAPLELDPMILCTASHTGTSLNVDPPIGRAEQHPHKWIKALHVCFKSLAPILQTHNYQLCGLGVSGQQHGMVPLDKNLQVVRPAKLWCDVEAAVEAKEFTDQASDVMSHVVLGRKIHWSTPPGFTAPKILWMKKHEPDFFARVRWVMLPHDYVTLCLSTGLGYDMNIIMSRMEQEQEEEQGKEIDTPIDNLPWEEYSRYRPSVAHLDVSSVIPTTDLGDASGTGFLHPEKPEYVAELAKLIHDDFESCLPRILSPNDVSGYLSNQWKDILLGKATATASTATTNDSPPLLGNHKIDRAIPISVGTGDNMASALGCKCIKTGNVVLSLGTSGTIFGVSDESSQVSKQGNGVPSQSSSSSVVAPFRDATGRYLPLVCVMSCTGVLNSVLNNWCVPPSLSSLLPSHNNAMEGRRMDHKEAIVLAKDVPVGCHGLTFLPYLGGERTPDWPHATGALLGLTPQNMSYLGGHGSGKSAGIMYRCAMEGITFLLADALEEMLLCCHGQTRDHNESSSSSSSSSSSKAHGESLLLRTPPSSIMVVGGGSKNPLWRQMLADVLGVNLLFPTEPESAALGAAFQAGAVATGVDIVQFIERQPVPMEDVMVTPTKDPTTLEMYRRARQRYREYSTKLFSS
jgi:Sugar (pentulose and hexulose) kinases